MRGPRDGLKHLGAGHGTTGHGLRALDRLLLASVVFISCLALSSYHRASHSISLTTTLSRGRGNSTTAYVILRDGKSSSSAKQRELAVTVIAGEGSRRPPLPRILLRYTACTGLINQHYSHIAAFSLAALLGADIVLPPAVCRDSFEHYFHTDREKNQVQWSPIPTDKILDVQGITEAWARLGIMVHPAPQLTPFPDMTEPQLAYPAYEGLPEGVTDRGAIVRLEGVYLKHLDLEDLTAMARSAAANVTRMLSAVQQGEGGRHGRRSGPPPVVVLDLPCTFFAINTASALPLVSKVAQSLAFNPHLRTVADRVVDILTRGGRRPFHGVHLRVENDAQDWAVIMGGKGQFWHEYIQAMREAGFNAGTPLYVACGLLSYGAGQDWQFTMDVLLHRDIASEVHYKEEYVPEFELRELNSEQRALLDFLVLARAARFVGFGSSTFSYFLREYRALHHGLPKSTTVLVNSTRIGTDKLFAAAGPVVADWEATGRSGAACRGPLSWLRCWGGRGRSGVR